MKVLAPALLALAHGSHSNKFSNNDLNNMVETGRIDKEKLLRSAFPVPRKLEDYQYNNNNVNNEYNQNQQNDQSNNNMNDGSNGNNGNQNTQQYYYQNNANGYNNQNTNGYNNNNQDAQYNNDNGQYSNNGNQQYDSGSNGNQYTDDANYDQQYQNEDGSSAQDEWQLPFNGNYTIRFNKCLSFAVEDEDIVANNDLIYYANSGIIVSQKSYVLFDIADCEPGNCVFDESDLSKVHVVPLDEFVESFLEYFPNKRETMCEQCMNHYNYCMSGQGSFFDSATFRNGGAFCYEGQQYEMINCGQCVQMGCWSGNTNGNANQNYQNYQNRGDVGEWVQEMAECRQTNSWWQDYPLYSGLMCNEAGDGVEFGVFIDEECKQYHRQKAFQNVIDDDDWQMLSKAPSLIEYMFTSSISCKDEGEISYMNAYQPVYSNNGQEYSNNEFEDEVEAEGNTCQLGEEINQSCLDLFQDNELGYSLKDCLNTVPQWSNNGDNQSYQNADSENYQNGDGYNIDESWSQNGLYDYELSAADVNDMGRTCHLIANKYAYFASGGTVGATMSSYTNTHSSGAHQNVYNEKGSGSMFDYDNAKNNYYTNSQRDVVVNPWGQKEGKLSFAEKFTFYSLGLIAGALAVLGAVRVYKSKTQSREVELVDKDLPLMS